MEDITVEELKRKLDAKEDFVFIDVREEHEYEDFNLGATLVPLGTLMERIPEFDSSKDSEVVVHCRSGKRSAAAKMAMEQMGFTKVRNLLGGVLDWKEKFESE